MSGPNAEGGPLPGVDPELLAAHERRIAEWRAVGDRVDELVRERAERARRIREGGDMPDSLENQIKEAEQANAARRKLEAEQAAKRAAEEAARRQQK